MMRILRILFLLFVAAGDMSSAIAGNGKPMLKATFQSTTLYYGIGPTGMNRPGELDITVTTPGGVYYGVWRLQGQEGSQLPLISWTGATAAPTITLRSYDTSVNRSNCKNLPSDWHSCGSFTLDITVQSDDYGCP